MGKHQTEDYKLSSVKYALRTGNQVETCEDFNCKHIVFLIVSGCIGCCVEFGIHDSTTKSRVLLRLFAAIIRFRTFGNISTTDGSAEAPAGTAILLKKMICF